MPISQKNRERILRLLEFGNRLYFWTFFYGVPAFLVYFAIENAHSAYELWASGKSWWLFATLSVASLAMLIVCIWRWRRATHSYDRMMQDPRVVLRMYDAGEITQPLLVMYLLKAAAEQAPHALTLHIPTEVLREIRDEAFQRNIETVHVYDTNIRGAIVPAATIQVRQGMLHWREYFSDPANFPPPGA